MSSLLRRTCLKPSYSLRRQLLLSFGLTALITVTIVVSVAVLFSQIAGRTVIERSKQLLNDQVKRRLANSSGVVAGTLSSYMQNLEGSVQLMTEVVRDRIVGYPDPGWEEDKYVPFFDNETGTNKYPLKAHTLPMDFELARNTDGNVNEQNAVENLQERYYWLQSVLPPTSTATASYYMQGVCDPAETNPEGMTYLENCTAANNDAETGGVIQPTPTSKGLYSKAADLGILLKPLFESQAELFRTGVYFTNSGAGSSVNFPGTVYNGTLASYKSLGCDWMRKINNNTGKPFASEKEIARCHPKNTTVPLREFNAAERAWFPYFALNSGISWFGPFVSANSPRPLVSIGRGVFDRRTGQLIGCVAVYVAYTDLSKFLKNHKIYNESDVSIIRLCDDTVFGSTRDVAGTYPFVVTDTDIISAENYLKLKNSVSVIKNLTMASVANEAIGDSAVYTANVLPLPPDEYDPEYKPEFLIIHAISNEVFAVTGKVVDEIDLQVRHICLLAFVVGACGVVLVLFIIWYVSRTLTQPLLWIKHVAWGIVNHADERASKDIGAPSADELNLSRVCVPTSEISKLVSEFRCMITGFSGEGASTVAHGDVQHEIKNEMTWHSDYQQLYSYPSKANEKKLSRMIDTGCADEESTGGTDTSTNLSGSRSSPHGKTTKQLDEIGIVPVPPKRNLGMNAAARPDELNKEGIKNGFGGRKLHAYRSSLFWWVMVLIVLPLVLTNVAICAIVSSAIVNTVPSWKNLVAEKSKNLELVALRSVTKLKATQAEMSVQDVVRDLHFMTRLTGWLLFGGISRSDSFTSPEEGTQECRDYTNVTCPFFSNPDRAPCACEWEDLNSLQCMNYSSMDARSLQKLYFLGQARDADNITGNRYNASSFWNGLDHSPNETRWWDNVNEVPGAKKGNNASGFETTYDRIRVSSAMSIATIPIYNYETDQKKPKERLTEGIAFEADGLFLGYSGCGYQYMFEAQFKSTVENMASIISPELCPLGKFGFDPRCRSWFHTGKTLYEANKQPVFITALHESALENSAFNSSATATSPVVNPVTEVYVGQTLINFIPSAVRSMLDPLTDYISFVIAPETNQSSGNTVVGPDKSSGWISAPIADLLFPHDPLNSSRQIFFEMWILPSLNNGTSNYSEFSRINKHGDEEVFTLAFEPVYARVLLPLDPSNFSRGVNTSRILVYSVGIAAAKVAIEEPWQTIEADVNNDLRRLNALYITIVCFVSLCLMLFSYKITVNVTKPLITLLAIVKTINAGKLEADLPPLEGGSREVHHVYNSFAKLYKIVRISNVTFFAGNLIWAYNFISDALKLFHKVGDQKAIGIACNNLGNTLHVMCSDARFDGKCCTAIPGVCVVTMAEVHYNEAIKIAQHQLEQASTDECKANFTQQLSDRLFNRALFLLLAHEGDCAPTDAKYRGLKDIEKARELDYDVSQFLLARKLLLSRSAEYFLRLLRRAFGLLDFYDDLDVREIWDANDIVKEADQLLFAAWNQPSAPLFKDLSRAGRLQQLEAVAIQLDLRRGHYLNAGHLAMRLFAEDEYILESTFAVAANGLLTLMRDKEEKSCLWTSTTKSLARSDFRKMLRRCKHVDVVIGKCLVIACEINERWEGDPLLVRVNDLILRLYDECLDEDDIGLIAYTTQGDLNVPISKRANNAGLQRTNLDLATTSTSERVCPSFPFAVQMLLDSAASTDNDSFILLLTDGYSWDSSSHLLVKSQIDKVNSERDTKIHVIILEMDAEEDGIIEECKLMCTVSKASFYKKLNLENIDETFFKIGRLFRGAMSMKVGLHGITMEKF